MRDVPDVWWRPENRPRIDVPFLTADEREAARRAAAAATAEAVATPLVGLPGLATALGVGELRVKDESRRFGLTAFKIAGVRFATQRLLSSSAAPVTTLVAATTGNHGRAVARVARERGLAARIYVPRDAEPARMDALRAEGAEVVVADAGYDEAVRVMARDAAAQGWTIVSDAAWDGYEQIPRWIMTGYTSIFEETRAQWAARPDVVIVQAGIGSLAGAAAAWVAATWPGADRPRFVVAEPRASACVLASLAAGRRVTLPAVAATKMAGLRCAEVSPLAWPILEAVADAAVAVSEAENDAALARLARGEAGDAPLALGPSGACGVAALTRLVTEDALAGVRARLGLTPEARVLAIATEGPVEKRSLA